MTIQQRKSHESAEHHVTGKAIYTDDQRLPADMLYTFPVMASHARAAILGIDPTPAYDVPGVVTVLTADDVPGENNLGLIVRDEVLFPTTEISHWGQAVVWVVAETKAAARLGASKVRVDYEPLEPILTVQAAIAAESFHGSPQLMQRGESLIALEESDYLLEGELEINGQDHFYLETQTSWVLPDGEGNYQVFSSTQHPTETQIMVARVLGIHSNRVVTTCLRMGGGFGGKETQANQPAAIAALAALKTQRPVQVRYKRDQDMILSGKRHGFLARYQVGISTEGKILAMKVNLYADGGWSMDLSAPILQRAMFHIDNTYYIPHLTVEGRIAKTHKVSNTAFRGFGGPQGMVVIEEILDRVARKLKLLPEVVRDRNFYHGKGETNTTHYGQEIVDNRIDRIWTELKINANFEQRRLEINQFNRSHAYQKRGLAITPVKFGISFTKTEYNQAGALILIYHDGSIQLNHGGTEMGQGLHTKMLQVASLALGVNSDRFRMMATSTDKVPNTSATAASSGTDLNGQAIKNACVTLKARLAPIAAKLLKLYGSEEMVFENDWIYCASYPSARVSFVEVIEQAYLERVSLAATGYYRTPNIYFDATTGKGKPFYYYAFGAAVSEVEVDGFTGTFKLLQVDIVHDVGDSLNPLIDRGQIEGGFVQGLGWLTMEELVWDEQGRFRTSAPSTYKIPTISEIPERFNLHLLERATQPGVIYGSKAVGEPPFMLAIAVREAIRDAVAAFGSTDRVPLASPATPEATLAAIDYVRSHSMSSPLSRRILELSRL
jgi:xanthine dehydrogenase large subunit